MTAGAPSKTKPVSRPKKKTHGPSAPKRRRRLIWRKTATVNQILISCLSAQFDDWSRSRSNVTFCAFVPSVAAATAAAVPHPDRSAGGTALLEELAASRKSDPLPAAPGSFAGLLSRRAVVRFWLLLASGKP